MADTLTWEEREEPRFIQFRTGDAVEGILLAVEEVNIKGKRAMKYYVQEPGIKIKTCFLGTHQINMKLDFSDIGHPVRIRCEGEDTMVKRGENCMKVFKIQVAKERVTTDGEISSDPGISDADIPF